MQIEQREQAAIKIQQRARGMKDRRLVNEQKAAGQLPGQKRAVAKEDKDTPAQGESTKKDVDPPALEEYPLGEETTTTTAEGISCPPICRSWPTSVFPEFGFCLFVEWKLLPNFSE